MKPNPSPEQILQRYFGYTSFRPGQRKIVSAILEGNDVMAIMPTGAGKSVCYQIPALMMEGITLVISPLISLMSDQVRQLISAGIPAAYLNSSLNFRQYKKALSLASKYKYKIIYVAPERLTTPGFLAFAQNVKISMVAVDEAHCVSQWGQNFRPSYLEITKFLEMLPSRPILSAFTATATEQVKNDVIRLLNLKDPFLMTTGFDRPNLNFEVRKPEDKFKELKRYIQTRSGECGIVYCLTRKQTDEIYEKLMQHGIAVCKYHGGMSEEERNISQDAFIYDRYNIIVATNAFGMGIDKSNVRYVIHYNMPSCLENYYQEAGRAGRDGEPSDCILLYSPRDEEIAHYLIDNSSNNENLDPFTQEVVKQQNWIRLQEMKRYCFTSECLRNYILKYFGEKPSEPCGHCSVCSKTWKETDMTSQGTSIGNLILSLPRSYGASLLTDILRGSRSSRIQSLRLNKNPAYGSLRGQTKEDIAFLFNTMISQGYLNLSTDGYRTLSVSPSLIPILNGKKKLIIKEEHQEPAASRISAPLRKNNSRSDELFSQLKALRFQLASQEGIPPYIIFNDRSLHFMADYVPLSREQMLKVPGVGELKYEKYGTYFLESIQKWNEEHPSQ